MPDTRKRSEAARKKRKPNQSQTFAQHGSPSPSGIKKKCKPKKLEKLFHINEISSTVSTATTPPPPAKDKAEKKLSKVVKTKSIPPTRHVQQPSEKKVIKPKHPSNLNPPKHHKMDERMSTEETPDFDAMRVKELKAYIQERGVSMSKYNKADLTVLAKSLHEMSASVDPDYENDSIEHCLHERLTLPASKKVPDPFKISNYSSSFGLMDIFNHLIISKAEYDKDMLASWRSFDEYTLCQNGHACSVSST